uniref:Uncharacterized protein n=1 Tax=Siphoviridae sp. cttU829 TaxID=2823605 RepID=A0A8S5LCD7_9CAUD|nr:MAG TPA: hypothetical protein [Siphoviridae sp. cttU829]
MFFGNRSARGREVVRAFLWTSSCPRMVARSV